jgi:hypothetical protein
VTRATISAAVQRRRRVLRRSVRIEGESRRAPRPHLRELRLDERAEGVEPERADEELEPVAVLVHAVAARVEHADHRLAEREEVLRGQELDERRACGAERRGAARHRHREPAHAAPALGADARAEAEVVDRGRDVIVGAALERDLELARQGAREGVAQEVARHGLGVRGHVERLVRRDAGEGAGDHVADRVPARARGGDAVFREPPERGLQVRRSDEVHLEVLAGRHVPVAAGEPLRHVGERAELRGARRALRQLDAQHVQALLALRVGAAAHAVGAPGVGVDLAALEAAERLDERVDLALVREALAGG